MEYYSCHTCGTHNEDYVKYCKRCGAWLVGDAKKVVVKKNKAIKNIVSTLFFLVVVVGALVFFFKPGSLGSHTSTNEIVFEDIEISNQFKISQFVISDPSSNSPTIAAELHSMIDTKLPLSIQAVFFDGNGNRVGIATTRIGHQLLANSTTTILFDIEDGNELKRTANVRIEIVNESPMETLERLL